MQLRTMGKGEELMAVPYGTISTSTGPVDPDVPAVEEEVIETVEEVEDEATDETL